MHFFFFSSRRRHPRFDCDWSSDVCSSDLVALAISDTGSGISPENLPRVFEPFYSGKPNGSGLGLTIAERIVGAHRSEERRVGKSVDLGGRRIIKKKKKESKTSGELNNHKQ